MPLWPGSSRLMTATMEPLVDVVIEDDRWKTFGLEAAAEAAGRAVLADLGLDPVGYVISCLGCDDARIAGLNADFRGKPAPTNVLSWPSEERCAEADGGTPDLPEPGAMMPEELGDIAIAWETCAREAVEQGKAMADHVTHLLVHGTLHLLGYDHIRDNDALLMEATETRILAGMGIANPYD
ncbi:putative rRNA maturation factor [Phaeovulum veldkampii DSM 11550]|nr:putative rRNA maturation factor [Phaeovulum veldkampii DSM 11550]